MKRVFLIVLDSFGVGAMPDAEAFGDNVGDNVNDIGVNTLGTVAKSPFFSLPALGKLGLFNIDGVSVPGRVEKPLGAYARMKEASMGKDTTIGHWEIAGVCSGQPLPVYPDGFPEEVLSPFMERTGRGILCNAPYSGTKVIEVYGEEHMRTGKLIVYTSADSVFQIAAHEETVPLEELYEDCRIAREILTGRHGVGRVIARPFEGRPGSFVRTAGRHDFSLKPPGVTMLKQLQEQGKEVIAVGKIFDIFAGDGISEHVYTADNEEGMDQLSRYLDKDFEGLCFVNLVDFDMLYGHRRDADGYAKALSAFDKRLPEFLNKLKEEDILMITADHGCDPGYTKTTDHTREYTPLLMYGSHVRPGSLGTRNTFADIGATVLKHFSIQPDFPAESML